MSARQPDLQCRHVVEMVTDYLERALAIEDRNQLEQHLLICGACETFVGQHTSMIRVLSSLAEDAPVAGPAARADALSAFRKLHAKDEP